MTETKSPPSNTTNEAGSAEKYDPQISKDLVTKAINALLKVHQKEVEGQDKNQLFGEDTLVQVCFNLEVPPVKQNPKPLRLVIPHELYKLSDDSDGDNLEEPEVCLLVKDDAKPWIQEMIEQFPEQMGHIKKVLTLDSLRKKHGEYKKRRALMQRYSVFMADDRIVPMLMKALGKKFFEANKQPIPIRITRKSSLPHMIRTALRATYINLSIGTSLSARAGFTSMSTDKLVENCIAIAHQAAKRIPRGWANIRAIGVRTPRSMLLPMYNRTPEQLEEIASTFGIPLVYVDEEKEDEDEEEKNDKSKRKRQFDAKSPLVQAIQKTKKSKKNEKQSDSTDKTGIEGKAGMDDKDDAEPKEPLDENEKEKKSDKVKPNSGTKDVNLTKKANKKSLSDTQEVEEENDASRKKDKNRKSSNEKESLDKEKSLEKESKSKKSAKVESDGHKSKKSKKHDKKQDEGSNNDDFISSKKFSGSKKGYVFQKGDQGLGYYRDTPPTVNAAAIDAILRAAKSKSSENKRLSSSSSSKGKRRGRR